MITFVILARNEEQNIVECLKALRPHAGEIILIDMESGDRTVELARPLVDKILTHPLVSNFDAARNVAIPEAQFNWLWFVDADERVSAETGRVVTQLVRERGDEFVALSIPFKSYFCGKWMEHCGWWPGYTMPRVLRRGHFRFADRLHGGVEFDGPLFRLPPDPQLGIDHFSYPTIQTYIEKFNRYTSTEAENLAADNGSLHWQTAIREMTRDLWVYYERNDGRSDGRHGWILSWLAGQYRWFSRTKLLDLLVQQGEGEDFNDAPPNIDAVIDVIRQELALLRRSDGQLSLEVLWRSPLLDPSGYAEDCRAMLKSLARGEREVYAEEIRWSDETCELPADDKALLRALLRGGKPAQYAAITTCIPTLCQPDNNAARNILRTIFETDRIPADWLGHLEAFDEVWVWTEFNRRAFIKGGVAPEKLHVVPGVIDTELFQPHGETLDLPGQLAGRFVFLSVFDWQLRKGWDVLLKAYCEEFSKDDNTGLLVKLTRLHGHTIDQIREQADTVLSSISACLDDRPDIVLWDTMLAAGSMPALYRSCSAFVLPTRGEGWGRPFMEAMACGLPTIGTEGSGNSAFMTGDNSFLIPSESVDVSEKAAEEIPVYRGHRWLEPDLKSLRQLMRQVRDDESLRSKKTERAIGDINSKFGLDRGWRNVEEQIARIERTLKSDLVRPVQAEQHRVVLEGELFAGHSFSNVNEQLALQFRSDESIALSLKRVHHNPTFDRQAIEGYKLQPLIERDLGEAAHVTIRHAFPPNWQPPESGRWIHIQPWEFGALPVDWVEPLRDVVDEIWAPSNYVKEVYLRSGIPAEKIQVIPWGVDPEVFTPDVPALELGLDGKFVFLFVGGTIPRKGFDLLFNAYIAEFGDADDVCLVIKDLGTKTFYRYGNFRNQVVDYIQADQRPQVIYLDRNMTPGQLASLYAACDCLAAPYRGEGFGLPILEAMACGLSAIVPDGGASDDFVSEETGFRLPSRIVECNHDWRLCGMGTELDIDVGDIRKALRHAYENRSEVEQKGKQASSHVRSRYAWAATARLMSERIHRLATSKQETKQRPADAKRETSLSVCIVAQNSEETIGNCLAHVRPFVDEIIVLDLGSNDRTVAVAQEYGARVYQTSWEESFGSAKNRAISKATKPWILSLEADELIDQKHLEWLRSILGSPDANLLGVRTRVPSCGGTSDIRVFRNRNDIVFHYRSLASVLPSIERLGGLIAESEIEIRRTKIGRGKGVTVAEMNKMRRLLHLDLLEHPGNSHLSCQMGKLHYADGNFFHAECYLSDSLATAPNGNAHSREAWSLLADCHCRTNNPFWAAQTLRSALNHFPGDEAFENGLRELERGVGMR